MLSQELQHLEVTGVFTNFGPVNTRFEQRITDQLFGGIGQCLTVPSATTGLILALKHAVFEKGPARRFALMPSFTFAAAGQAALWAGLTPLFCDVDQDRWAMSCRSAEELLDQYGKDVAVIFPYASFGTDIDLEQFLELSRRYCVPIVIDAAASLGTLALDGRSFGSGFPFPVVFSMHVTKLFATAEAGLIYCYDRPTAERLRAMTNFGFEESRHATIPGLNGKLPEVIALLALERLLDLDSLGEHRSRLAAAYRAGLLEFEHQFFGGQRQAITFMPLLLPRGLDDYRDQILSELEKNQIGCRKYFSPHLAEHPYFAERSVSGDLTVTRDVSRRIISLPMSDLMTVNEVEFVCSVLCRAVRELSTHFREC